MNNNQIFILGKILPFVQNEFVKQSFARVRIFIVQVKWSIVDFNVVER